MKLLDKMQVNRIYECIVLCIGQNLRGDLISAPADFLGSPWRVLLAIVILVLGRGVCTERVRNVALFFVLPFLWPPTEQFPRPTTIISSFTVAVVIGDSRY